MRDLDLYRRREYAVVAVRRHTKTFVYYTDVGDLITRMIRGVMDLPSEQMLELNVKQRMVCTKVGYEM